MNREDIIKLAREQGLPETETEGVFRVNTDDLGRMLAAEREKVATWMTRQGYATGHGDTVEDLLKELDWQIRESEREACAALLDVAVENFTSISLQVNDEDGIVMEHANTCKHLADAIRARSEQ